MGFKMNALKKAHARGVSMKDKAAVAALLAIASAASMAQTTDPTTDQGVQAITDLGTKASSYIAAAFTVAVLVAGGFWGIKMMKKAFGASK